MKAQPKASLAVAAAILVVGLLQGYNVVGQTLNIQLEVIPRVIDVNLTEDMYMSCVLGDTASAMVSHLVSIVITREDLQAQEELVASVSSFDAAKALVDAGSISVNGTVQNPKASDNFLSLVWDHPTERQASKYKCEINAIDNNARPVMFTTSFTVISRVATIEDIVHHVRILESRDVEQQKEIEELKKISSRLEARLMAIEQKNSVVG